MNEYNDPVLTESNIDIEPQTEPPVHKMDSAAETHLEGGRYLCNSEWHLRKIHYVYSHALRLSRKSGYFFGSQRGLAEFFECSPSTMWRAFDELEAKGFFEVVDSNYGDPNCYRVLTHDEWASKHPEEKCAAKIEYPWTSENDPLGQSLYSLSGGCVKWKRFQIDALRNAGLSEDKLKEHFTDYWNSVRGKIDPKYVPAGFLTHLKYRIGLGTLDTRAYAVQ